MSYWRSPNLISWIEDAEKKRADEEAQWNALPKKEQDRIIREREVEEDRKKQKALFNSNSLKWWIYFRQQPEPPVISDSSEELISISNPISREKYIHLIQYNGSSIQLSFDDNYNWMDIITSISNNTRHPIKISLNGQWVHIIPPHTEYDMDNLRKIALGFCIISISVECPKESMSFKDIEDYYREYIGDDIGDLIEKYHLINPQLKNKIKDFLVANGIYTGDGHLDIPHITTHLLVPEEGADLKEWVEQNNAALSMENTNAVIFTKRTNCLNLSNLGLLTKTTKGVDVCPTPIGYHNGKPIPCGAGHFKIEYSITEEQVELRRLINSRIVSGEELVARYRDLYEWEKERRIQNALDKYKDDNKFITYESIQDTMIEIKGIKYTDYVVRQELLKPHSWKKNYRIDSGTVGPYFTDYEETVVQYCQSVNKMLDNIVYKDLRNYILEFL